MLRIKSNLVLLLVILSGIKLEANPDFLILGVTKCGTTSLYDYLCHHPKIQKTRTGKKELHFFDGKYRRGIEWYKRQFPQKKSGYLTGEASPGYFWKGRCLNKILKHCPTTKFIVIFRDPVKRIISEYFRLKRRGEEWLPFDKAIKWHWTQRYLVAGMYIKHLERWLKHFPKEQFHIMILEDLKENSEEEVNKVFRFLGLEDYKLNSYEIRNQASYDINSINKETINELKKMYEPYNKQLEHFLGRTLPWGK